MKADIVKISIKRSEIIVEFENNKITYKLGTLEDLKMRKDIMPILEGGKEAFRKREEKYGI